MEKIEINGIQYQAVIIDNAIVLQSLTQDLVFENGYDLLRDEARNLWVRKGRGFGVADFIAEYIHDNLEQWVKNNLELGKLEKYHLN